MIYSFLNRVAFISAILQNLRTNCHYLGTASRGQINTNQIIQFRLSANFVTKGLVYLCLMSCSISSLIMPIFNDNE